MNRFDIRSRGRHEDAQDKLLSMIIALRTTVDVREKFGTVQRQNVIATVQAVRPGIQACHSLERDIYKGDGHDDGRMYIEEPRYMNHVELVEWLTLLSMHMRTSDPTEWLTIDKLHEGERLVNALDNCRERLVFDR